MCKGCVLVTLSCLALCCPSSMAPREKVPEALPSDENAPISASQLVSSGRPRAKASAVIVNTSSSDSSFSGAFSAVCWFECGTTTGLINMGNARSPKMVCNPCVRAKRGLDTSCRGNDGACALLKDMKANKQSDYKAKVRSCRIDPTHGGLKDAGEQREHLSQFSSEVKKSISTTNKIPVLWLLENEWVAHHKFAKNMSDEDAILSWTVAEAKPVSEVPRKGEGVNLRLGCLGILSTSMDDHEEVSKTISKRASISGGEQMDRACKKLQNASKDNIAHSFLSDRMTAVVDVLNNSSGSASSSAFMTTASAHVIDVDNMIDNNIDEEISDPGEDLLGGPVSQGGVERVSRIFSIHSFRKLVLLYHLLHVVWCVH